MRTINYQFKLMYAIGIILVVLYHIGGYSTLDPFAHWLPIGNFHLAIFAFSSGYFYQTASEKNLKSFVYKKGKSLLLPLFTWNCVYGLLLVPILKSFGIMIGCEANLYELFVAPLVNGHSFVYNMGSWFLAPLFLIQVYVAIVRKVLMRTYRIKNKYLIFGLFLIQGLSGNALSFNGYNTGWWLVLSRCNYFIPFFAAGRLYKVKLEEKDNLPSIAYFYIIMTALLFILMKYQRNVSCTPSWCNDFADPYIPIIMGMIGIAACLRITRIFNTFGQNKYVLLVADHSFDIMMHQFLGFMLVKALFYGLSRVSVMEIAFNLEAFRNDIWYYCYPGNWHQFFIVYATAGIVVPIAIGEFMHMLKYKGGNVVKRIKQASSSRE